MKATLAVCLALVSGAACAQAASNTAPAASIQSAISQCRAKLAAQAPRVRAMKDGGFIKTQEMGAQFQLELPTTASPSDPQVAVVDITTSLVSVMARSEEAVRQLPLSSDGPSVTKIARRYRFEWTGRHWSLSDASLRLEIKAPGMFSLPTKDKKIEPSDARKGFDAGATCVQTIESTYWRQS